MSRGAVTVKARRSCRLTTCADWTASRPGPPGFPRTRGPRRRVRVPAHGMRCWNRRRWNVPTARASSITCVACPRNCWSCIARCARTVSMGSRPSASSAATPTTRSSCSMHCGTGSLTPCSSRPTSMPGCSTRVRFARHATWSWRPVTASPSTGSCRVARRRSATPIRPAPTFRRWWPWIRRLERSAAGTSLPGSSSRGDTRSVARVRSISSARPTTGRGGVGNRVRTTARSPTRRPAAPSTTTATGVTSTRGRRHGRGWRCS